MPNVPASPAPDTAGSRQVARAEDLERRRAALQEEISANRELLRLLHKGKELTAEQSKWLSEFYPEKERGALRTKEEVERTRKVKEAARKTAA